MPVVRPPDQQQWNFGNACCAFEQRVAGTSADLRRNAGALAQTPALLSNVPGGLCDSYIVEGLCPQLIVSFLRDRKRSAIAKIIQSHPIRLSRAPRGKRGDDRQAKSDGPDDEWNIVRSRWRDGGEERRKQCGDGRAEVLRDRHS
jgi:hypothetical protein